MLSGPLPRKVSWRSRKLRASGCGVEAGVFIDENPEYLAKLFSAMDQVLLADWVEHGMKAPGGELAQRLGQVVERVFVKG